MKTIEQIRSNSINLTNTYTIIDKYVDKCTEGLNDNVRKGRTCYECIIDEYNNSLKEDKIIAKKVALKLVSLGFHVKYGWRETTPSGNERAIVVVSTNKIESTEKSNIKQAIIVAILTLSYFLFLILMFEYKK